MSSTTARCAEVMRHQAGVIGRAQAIDAGLSERQIDHRIATRQWTRLFPGVYLSADAELTWTARAHAATLASGPQSTLVGESAAAVRGQVAERLPIHVAIPPELRRRVAASNVVMHRLEVAADERLHVGGFRTTTRLRTAIDVAHLMPVTEAQPILDRMLVLDEVDLDTLTAAIAGSRRTGSAQARRLMRSANDRTAAESERLVRRLFREAGMPGWVSNHPVTIGGVERKVDLANKRLRIAIEVKGWVFHSKVDRAMSDDSRVVNLQLSSWIVIPVGWLAINTAPHEFLDQVRRAIAFRERGRLA
jgi:hypothetical protein